MICIYCGDKTQVTNSRRQTKTNSTWRRRMCDQCNQVTTSIETYDLSSCVLVSDKDGKTSPFIRDQLLISIYEACKHRSNPAKDSGQLTDTVISLLMHDFSDGLVDRSKIIATAVKVLTRFDKAAGVQYGAFHKA